MKKQLIYFAYTAVITLAVLDQFIKNFKFKRSELAVLNSSFLFGLGGNINKTYLIISIILAAIIAAFFIYLKIFWEKLGLLLIFSGATSNIIDKIRFNAVIDYFSLFGFSKFNLGDVMIYAGVGVILNFKFQILNKISNIKYLRKTY